jgi:hypothetical protein
MQFQAVVAAGVLMISSCPLAASDGVPAPVPCTRGLQVTKVAANDRLAHRTGPSVSSYKMQGIPPYALVEDLRQGHGSWMLVRFQSKIGWSHRRYLQRVIICGRGLKREEPLRARPNSPSQYAMLLLGI